MKAILPQAITMLLAFGGTMLADDSRAPINTVPKEAFEDFRPPKSKTTSPSPAAAPSAQPESKPASVNGTAAPAPTAEAPKPAKREKPNLGPRREAAPELRARARDDDDSDELMPSISGMKRWVEARAGAKFSTLYGDITPITSTKLNYQHDLRLKNAELGMMINFDMQLGDDTHFDLGFTHTSFNASAILDKPIQYQGIYTRQSTLTTLPVGSFIKSSIDMTTVQGMFRYDAVKEDGLTFSPLFGFKVVFLDQEAIVTSGVAGSTSVSDRDIVASGTPLAGFDMRFPINKHIYTGLAAYGFGWDSYTYAGSQWYWGFDFTKRWGLRFGLDVDYLDAQRRAGGNNYDTVALLPSGYLQLVCGF